MKRKRCMAFVLAFLMLLLLFLAGCGAKESPAETPTDNAKENQSDAADEGNTDNGENTSEMTIPEIVVERPEPAKETSDMEQPSGLVCESFDDSMLPSMPGFAGGDVDDAEVGEGKELSAEEQEDTERQIREYRGSGVYHPYDAYPVNYASNFYFYSQMDYSCQMIYDAIIDLTDHLYEANYKAVYRDYSCSSESEFRNNLKLVINAVQYDHPELFFLRNRTVDVWYSYRVSDHVDAYFSLTGVNSSVEMNIRRFNAAWPLWTELLDYSSTADIIKSAHDLLIYNVVYDYYVAENNLGGDLAHTAFGALIGNDRGQDFCAVCDGYSLAFEYLMQQSGVDAVMITGPVGKNYDNMGRHAWNMVKTSNGWKELDVTWDDYDIDQLDPYSTYYAYFYWAASDPYYWEKITHNMFLISTDRIEHFDVGAEYWYEFRDGTKVRLIGDSVRYRDISGAAGEMMAMAPIAY